MSRENLSLIELFSGIGAQITGIELTKLYDCTVVNTSEIDKDAMLSYAAIHKGLTLEMVDTYEGYPTREEMAKYMTERNIGYDFKKKKPYDWYKLAKRKDDKMLNKYWLACVLTNNLGDITRITQLRYADLWTYSFPCQDISLAGRLAGIVKGETRSGLLYEVERLLEKAKETNTLPKYLMLENVKNLVGEKFKALFDKWVEKLNELGYNTYWQVINSKDCGIPQNRERVFAISIRKDIDKGKFTFPKPILLRLRLKNLLYNKGVDDCYYLTDKSQVHWEKKEYTDQQYIENLKPQYNYVRKQSQAILNKKGYLPELYNAYNESEIKDIAPTQTAASDRCGTSAAVLKKEDGLQIRKLTPDEVWLLMGFKNTDADRARSVGVSNNALYHQGGNSIVTNCIALIFEHLYKAQVDNDYICEDEKEVKYQNFCQPRA